MASQVQLIPSSNMNNKNTVNLSLLNNINNLLYNYTTIKNTRRVQTYCI